VVEVLIKLFDKAVVGLVTEPSNPNVLTSATQMKENLILKTFPF